MHHTTHRTGIISLTAVVLAAGVLVAAPPAQKTPASPSDWPQWRGPNRDAVSADTGLLKQWPDGGPPLAWKIKGVGTGFSSVSVADGRIFTMGDKGASSYVHALDLGDGHKLWSAKVGKPGGNYPGTRSTPTVDGDRVYALGQYGDL